MTLPLRLDWMFAQVGVRGSRTSTTMAAAVTPTHSWVEVEGVATVTVSRVLRSDPDRRD